MAFVQPLTTTPAHETSALQPEETPDNAEESLVLLERCGLDVGATPLVALYFSAAWCGPCKVFTPILKQFHAACQADAGLAAVFRPVFVSFDHSAELFNEYFGTMTWEAVRFELRDEREKLADLLQVGGIPCLVVLDTRHRRVVSFNARADIQKFVGTPQHLTQKWLARFGEAS